MRKDDSHSPQPMARATLRDPKNGWLSLAVLFYCFVADAGGLLLLLSGARQGITSSATALVTGVCGIFLSAHGRILASYLVHEAAHANIFVEPYANRWFGRLCLWLAGCPYADFAHIKFMHMSHHNDRADTVEFDYRTFVRTGGFVVKLLVLAGEFCFVPVVETIMHTRTALFPLVCPYNRAGTRMTPERFRSALVGVPVELGFYFFLYRNNALLLQLISGALVLQYLALNDAFHHTYEAIMMADYTPGPGWRTPQYEEENTYSNLISIRRPILNAVLALNFGYHNAHHQKAMTPWYKLPQLHETLYGPIIRMDAGATKLQRHHEPQLMPYYEVLQSWYRHRLRRVLEEDYGKVGQPGQAGRADQFIGALGVSFLTV